MKKFFKKINFRELGILYALIILWVLLFATNRTFRDADIYISILREGSILGICGIGMTFCIASRHFDQSIASMMALLACVYTALLTKLAPSAGGAGIFISFLCVMALSVVLGAFNGFLVAKLRIPAFIATLGTLYVYRALAYIVSGGDPVIINQIVSKEQYGFFRTIGMGSFLGLPVSFWIMLICAVTGTVILRKTKLGRHTLAIGNSVSASRISGINIDRTKIYIFTLVGAFVGVGTILNAAFLGSSNPGMSAGYEFVVISTVVLGGTALSGGKGSIFTSIAASIFLVTVTAGMNAFGMDSFAQRVVQGVILLFAFSINGIRAAMENRRVKSEATKHAKATKASASDNG
ncbi:MAG: ABC transporter permease [Clostridiales Family XIII bacterium]|jgi:ribose/xylose/arabinose/galactoside ABC-type transport system permease subunit|nr:ABC transporter permease [Clostridiales Family XIII bacterium]